MIFYLEASLHQEELQAIGKHLQECEGCKNFAEEVQKTLALIDYEKEIPINPYFYTRLKSRMEIKREEKISGFPFFMRVLQPVVFSFLLIAGVYSGYKIGRSPFNSSSLIKSDMEMVPFLNEMADEPIESFLMD